MGFLSGIFFHSFFNFGYWFSFFFLFLGLMLYAIVSMSGFQVNLETRHPNGVFIVALFLFAVGVGLLRYDVVLLYRGDGALIPLVGEEVVLRGIVTEEPDERETNVRLTVSLYDIEKEEGLEEVKTKMLLIAPLFPRFSYGDELEMFGILTMPDNFSNENGREFDYISYLAKDGIFYQMFFPEIKIVSSGNGNLVKRKLFEIKNGFLGSIGRLIPEPESSLAGGLIVGAKRSLGAELLDKFRKTGIIHIVVLSGYNVTIIAQAIARFFQFLPRFAGLSLGALSIVFFTVMTGASATIVRASIMALLVIVARATGRISQITTALLFAAFFMLFFNPYILVFDPSFQLSFLATLGLLYLAPYLERYFRIAPEIFGFRDVAVATVATQVFVLPLLLYQTGELSLISLPVNLLILLFVPLTMLFGFMAGTIGLISIFAALPFAFIAYGLLSYQLKVVEIFSSLPFASIALPPISFATILMMYGVYAVAIYFLSQKTLESLKTHNN